MAEPEFKRQFELLADQVMKYLPGSQPERTRDAIQIHFKGSREITLILTPEAIEFRLPRIDWTMGYWGPAESSRLWKRFEVAELMEIENPEELYS